MSVRTDYDPDDWSALQDTLLLPALLVSVASPQGRVGQAYEIDALSTGLSRILQAGAGFDLIDDLRQDLRDATQAGALAARFQRLDEAQLRSQAAGRARQAATALAQRASPPEAEYYQQGVLWVCWQVAAASKEGGGFLGAGATRISDAERDAIRQIAFALGLPAPQPGAEQAGPPAPPPLRTPRPLGSDFSLEEWQSVLQAPLWSAAALIAADQSSMYGTAREISAMTAALQQARAAQAGSRLLPILIDDLSLGGGAAIESLAAAYQQARETHAVAGFVDAAVAAVGAAAGLVSARLGDAEGQEFRRLLLDVARAVAEAAKEGSFLGIGGQRVSPAEQAVLERLSAALAPVDPPAAADAPPLEQ